MKKSRAIPLVVLGTLGLGAVTGCSERVETYSETEKQAFYNSLEDCQKDWGDAQYCQPSGATTSHPAQGGYVSGVSGEHQTSYAYAGPRYYWQRMDNGGGHPVAVMPSGEHRPLTNTAIGESSANSPPRAAKTAFLTPARAMAVARGGFGSSSRGLLVFSAISDGTKS